MGDKKDDAPNPREGQPTAEGANGKTLYANTSNLTYSNTQQNSADKTLATLGHGNITVGGTQLEKDGELTDAGKATNSPLIGMNRDTANTEKELWNSEQSQTVDATLDHRLLSKEGWKDIAQNVEDTAEGAKAAIDKTVDVLDDTRIAVKEFLGIDSELSTEQSAALSFQLAGSTGNSAQSLRDLSRFSAEDQALIQHLEVLKQQYSASDSSTEGAIYWETVIDMAYDSNYGPRKAIMALSAEVGRKDLNYISNIDLLRHEVEIVKDNLANAEATVGQAGNVAYGSSMFLRAGQAITEGVNAGLDSAKRLIKETDAITGGADDVTPKSSNIAGDVKEALTEVKQGSDNNPNINATKNPETETYFRVEGGGSGNATSQNRITANADGTISINPGCAGQLCVSVGNADHATYFLTNKRADGSVVVFEVDAKLHKEIMDNAIPQRPIPGVPRDPNAPQIVDPNQPGTAIQLPKIWEKLLENNSSNARVLTQDEFLREFGE